MLPPGGHAPLLRGLVPKPSPGGACQGCCPGHRDQATATAQVLHNGPFPEVAQKTPLPPPSAPHHFPGGGGKPLSAVQGPVLPTGLSTAPAQAGEPRASGPAAAAGWSQAGGSLPGTPASALVSLAHGLPRPHIKPLLLGTCAALPRRPRRGVSVGAAGSGGTEGHRDRGTEAAPWLAMSHGSWCLLTPVPSLPFDQAGGQARGWSKDADTHPLAPGCQVPGSCANALPLPPRRAPEQAEGAPGAQRQDMEPRGLSWARGPIPN